MRYEIKLCHLLYASGVLTTGKGLGNQCADNTARQ